MDKTLRLPSNGMEATLLHWPTETTSPNTLEYLSQRMIDLVINIPKDTGERELTKSWQEYGATERGPNQMPRLPSAEPVQTGTLAA